MGMSLVHIKASQKLVVCSSFHIFSSNDKEILVSKEIQIHRIAQDHICKLPISIKFAILSCVSRKVWAKPFNFTVYPDLLFVKAFILRVNFSL